jgi:hypothetical protein
MGDTEVQVFALASRQLGLVTRAQLASLGVTDSMIRVRVRAGRLVRIRHRVYAVAGHEPSRTQAILAAVLAAGSSAAASHLTAAWLWQLPVPEPDEIEVTTVLERAPALPGVRLHRSGLLVDLDRTTLGAVPVHSVERTAADLSTRLNGEQLGSLIDDALRRRLTSYTRLWRVHERLPLAPGRSPKRLEAVLVARTPGIADRESELEDRVYEVIRTAGLPLPVPQHRVVVGGRKRRIDLAYPEHRLAIEADGFDTHRTRSAFDDDRLRGNEMVLAGYRPLHFTSRMTDEQIADHVRRALTLFEEKPVV